MNDTLNRNIIEQSTSPWSSPVVLFKKKMARFVFVSTIKKYAYPLPLIADTLDTLTGSNWFTTLDLLSGYLQVQLDDDAKASSFWTSVVYLFSIP